VLVKKVIDIIDIDIEVVVVVVDELLMVISIFAVLVVLNLLIGTGTCSMRFRSCRIEADSQSLAMGQIEKEIDIGGELFLAEAGDERSTSTLI